MTKWKHSVCEIIPDADKDEAEALMLEFGRNYKFTVLLSSTGKAPITHWGLHAQETAEMATQIMGKAMPSVEDEVTKEKDSKKKQEKRAKRDKLIDPEVKGHTKKQMRAKRAKMIRSNDKKRGQTPMTPREHFEAVIAEQGLQIVVQNLPR